MVDYADQSDHKIEAEVVDGVAKIRAGRTGIFANLRPTGFCAWCHEPVSPGRLHCAPLENSCAEDHRKYLRFRGVGEHRE